MRLPDRPKGRSSRELSRAAGVAAILGLLGRDGPAGGQQHEDRRHAGGAAQLER